MKRTITQLIEQQEIIPKGFEKLETYFLIAAGAAYFCLLIKLLV